MKHEYFSARTDRPRAAGGHRRGRRFVRIPGYLESRDRKGDIVWRWNTTPRPGEPGAETGPLLHVAGGGMPWIRDLRSRVEPYISDRQSAACHARRAGKGDNLYTCSIVALNPDTGKMAWYYQVSPHDTHDWDNVETPVLIDGEFNGQPRKMLAQAARNGYFVLLDRTNGKNLLTAPFVEDLNWSKGLDATAGPFLIPTRKPSPMERWFRPPRRSGELACALVQSVNGLFYAHATESYSIYYRPILEDTRRLLRTDENSGRGIIYGRSIIRPARSRGSCRLSRPGRHRSGLLSTAGELLFGGDPTGNLIAFDPAKGRMLWHAGLHRREQRADYVRAGWPSIFGSRGRRHAVRVHVAGELTPHFLPRRQTTFRGLEFRKSRGCPPARSGNTGPRRSSPPLRRSSSTALSPLRTALGSRPLWTSPCNARRIVRDSR